MRRINPDSFRVATRGTSREINRQIALNLIRTRQPLSRADLARLMGLRRGAVSLLVGELIAGGLVFEGAKGNLPRGRKPKSLFIDSRERCLLAADVRASGTHFMVADLLGRPLADVVRHPTERDPVKFVSTFAGHVAELLAAHAGAGACQGVGVVVPGMVDRTGNRVVFAPQLGWRDVVLREPLAQALGLPVQMANAGRACALAQAWSARGEAATGDVVFVTVSDGVGVGIITGGEMLQGRHNMAGEFGHVPLSLDGPACSCGARGCWEAYVSNLATLSRYLGRSPADGSDWPTEVSRLTVDDVVARARAREPRALEALRATARYLGLGLASIVNGIDPARIYVGGEITRAWDLLETTVRAALRERVLFPAAGDVSLAVVPAEEYPRLRGAAALVAAPTFAAPVVA